MAELQAPLVLRVPTSGEPAFIFKMEDQVAEGALRQVLVVDDSSEILELFRILLESEGFAVTTSRDGTSVPRLLESSRPDLVILDLLLPDLNGDAVLEAIRANPATSALPVIVCSAASRELERLEAALHALGCAVLRKPFDLDELLACVRCAVRG
jgi:DNA-binding response OmpR family regulator